MCYEFAEVEKAWIAAHSRWKKETSPDSESRNEPPTPTMQAEPEELAQEPESAPA